MFGEMEVSIGRRTLGAQVRYRGVVLPRVIRAVRDLRRYREAEVGLAPECLVLADGRIRVEFAVPGFSADEICLTAYPTRLSVKACANENRREASLRPVATSVELPAQVDTRTVEAQLDAGILRVTMETLATPDNTRFVPIKVKSTSPQPEYEQHDRGEEGA